MSNPSKSSPELRADGFALKGEFMRTAPAAQSRRGQNATNRSRVKVFGVRGEEFDGDVDKTLVQKADDDASLAGHCRVDGVAGEEITE
jgi:hypothetical protein